MSKIIVIKPTVDQSWEDVEYSRDRVRAIQTEVESGLVLHTDHLLIIGGGNHHFHEHPAQDEFTAEMNK
jgi:hypothetical protein